MHITYLSLIFAIASFSRTTAQQPPLSVKAQFLSVNLQADSTHKEQYWQPMHKNPSGYFTCRTLSDGKLEVSYEGDSKLFIYKKMEIKSEDKLIPIPSSIGEFSLYGIYFEETLPFDMVRAIYINAKQRNSLLMLLRSIYSEEVLSAVYFSDKIDNPLEKKGLLQERGKTVPVMLHSEPDK